MELLNAANTYCTDTPVLSNELVDMVHDAGNGCID